MQVTYIKCYQRLTHHRHDTMITDVNNAVDGRPLFLTSVIVDPVMLYTKAISFISLICHCICCKHACTICQQQINQLESEHQHARNVLITDIIKHR